MKLRRENLYHLFNNCFLGIFPKNTASPGNVTGFVLEDTFLYHQPVLDPVVATIFSSIWVILLVVGSYLHLRVLISLKQENGILKEITYIFVPVQMILWPFMSFVIASTNFLHPLNALIGDWFCSLSQFILYFLKNIIAFHSFFAALMRYLFIVHSSKVKLYGNKKMKKLFLCLSVMIPLSITIWKINNGAELDGMTFINKCNGKHHEAFLAETSTINVFKKSFCEFEIYHKGDVYGQMIMILKQISCMANTFVMIFIGSNITEGIIYYRLFSHMNR